MGINKKNRKLELLETPYLFTSKSGVQVTFEYALTLDCGHIRYLNHPGTDTDGFLENWKEPDHMYCKNCQKKLDNMNAMIESADDFTDWGY